MANNISTSHRLSRNLLAWVTLAAAIVWLVILVTHDYRMPQPGDMQSRALAERPQAGQLAPDFTLVEAHDADHPESATLSKLTQDGPVLVIFHLGLQCERCAAQLKELADLLPEFQNAGFAVVAIGPDSPAETRERLKEYGDIPLPLLSDPDGNVAESYGLSMTGEQLHGAFVIGRDGKVKLSEAGDDPFTNYQAMLDAGRADSAGRK